MVSPLLQEDQRKLFLSLSLIDFGRNSKGGKKNFYLEAERKYF